MHRAVTKGENLIVLFLSLQGAKDRQRLSISEVS